MSTVQSIYRIFCILLVSVFMLGIRHAQAQMATVPAGLSNADWMQIKALMPATTIDAQQAYVKASNTGVDDNFGAVIAVSGDTLVVGAPYEASNATGVDGDQSDNSAPGSGAVYVFTRSGSVWSQQAYLKASNTESNDHFGAAIALSGDTLVVAAPEEDSNASGVGGNQADNSAPGSGAVYVFARSGSVWSQQAYLKASNSQAGDWFGISVAVSGDTLAVTATGEASNATGVNGNQNDDSASSAGAAYVFARSGSVWSQQAYIKASNTGVGDSFGVSVALSGDILVVGSPYEASSATGVNRDQTDNSAFGAGAVYAFTRSGSVWSQQAYIKASNSNMGDQFGWSVALSGETLVVGANKVTFGSGAAYFFTRSGSDWSQQGYFTASNGGYGDGFGGSVAISGDTLVVGASSEDGSASGVNGPDDDENDNSGAVYVFVRNDNTWGQQAYVKASNTEANDWFGSSVAISAGTIMVGAPQEASNAIGINGDQANNSTLDSGAVYVLALPPLVVSSLRANANPTLATNVNFTLTFSEPMTGMDASDLALTTADGMSSASITGIIGGPTVYTVSVATGSGEDTIRLDVLDDDTILSVAESTPLGGAGTGNGDFTSGQVYTIDRTGPRVTDIWENSFGNGDYIELNVRFSKPVTGVDTTDFHLTTTGGITGESISWVSGSGYDSRDYIVAIETGVHIGTIRLDVVDNDSIMDAGSNPLGGPGVGNGNFSSMVYKLSREATSTFYSTSAQDGWILESGENSNKGGALNATAKTFQLGDDALNRQYRVILSFNTAPIPDNAIIKSVVLNISQSGAPVGGNPFSTLGNLLVDIRKGSFGLPTLQLADFSAPASAARVGYFQKTFPGYNASLNATGRSKINKLGLTQLRLYFIKDDNNNRKADFMRFVAHYTLGDLPKLMITYSVP
jgi:hypothetical protein